MPESQFFGGWYSTATWFVFSAFFFYIAFSAGNLAPHIQQRLPPYLLNRPLCLFVASVLGALSLFSALMAAPNAAPPLSNLSLPQTFSWKEIDANGRGDSIAVDVISRNGHLVEYWAKITFKIPRSIGASRYASVFIDKYIANCSSRTLSHLVTMAQSAEGLRFNAIQIPKPEQAFAAVPGNEKSPDAILVNHVCARKSGDA
jgi:hypothetical protein